MTEVQFVSDHYAWQQDDAGRKSIAMRSDKTGIITEMILDSGNNVIYEKNAEDAIAIFELHPDTQLGRTPLQESHLSGRVARLSNLSLWTAIGTNVIRQVIRAGHARKMYETFCREYGESILINAEINYCLFPSPEECLKISDDEFAKLGMSFKKKALRSVAEAYINNKNTWIKMDGDTLIRELMGVKQIGDWTARATVADWTNDWSYYPHSDLAIRTYARKVLPLIEWHDDPNSFDSQWRDLAQDQLSALTLLAIAKGVL